MPWIAAAGLVAGAAGGIMSANAKKDAAEAAQSEVLRNQGLYDQIADPDYQNMLLQLDQLVQQGQIDPAMEQAILQDPSLMQNVSQDPRLQKAQMDALATLGNISADGGMDPQAMLAMREAQMSSQSAARGSREANLQNAQARGASGSGLEFVSNQMADQNAANQSELVGMQQAGMANDRDMDALKQYASLANTMGQQDVSLQSAKAQAADARNRFNTSLRGDVQQRNIGAQNTAQAQNLGEAQRISDQNALIRNSQQQYNKGIDQQKFQNDLSKVQGKTGLTAQSVNAIGQAGQANANMWAGLGQGANNAASAIGNYYAGQDKKKKEDEE